MGKENIVLKVENLKKYFPIKRGVLKKIVGHVKAVDDISFFIEEGETLGLVGESGCGKSTTGRCITKLLESTAGSIEYRKDDQFVDLSKLSRREMKEYRRDIQIVFQDPFSSLDSRMSIRDIVAEPLRVQKVGTYAERTERVAELLEKVGLSSQYMHRYPHQFSGGQRQRIGIARALALQPKLIICDEPVSALDVSVQAQVLNLLSDLQEEFKLTYLFIAHDLSVIEHISDRIIVMYLGKIVEVAKKEHLYSQPKHPYTEALLASIPVADPRAPKNRFVLEGTVPDPTNPPDGCNFHTRCPYASDICRNIEPELREVQGLEQFVACHFADKLTLAGYVPVDNQII